MRCLADPKHSIINLKAMCGTGSRHTRQIWKTCARSAAATHECSTRNAPTITEREMFPLGIAIGGCEGNNVVVIVIRPPYANHNQIASFTTSA